MPIKIALTTRPEHIDSILKVRHQVFCEEEGKFPPTPDGRVLDRFDAYSSTHNVAIFSGDKVVGGMRLTFDSAMGLPGDAFFDFRAHVPEGARLLNVGMYCVLKEYRSHRVALGLMLLASYFAMSRDITHVVAPINPAIAKLLKRVGFEALTDAPVQHHDLDILPVVLAVDKLSDFFSNFVRNNQLYNFIESYECFFFEAGEYVVRYGEDADAAFLIVEGEVRVLNPHNQELLAVMGPGEVFGELALLIDDVRSADVVAGSSLRIMSLPRARFLDHLRHNPDSAMMLLQSMGRRLRDMLTAPV